MTTLIFDWSELLGRDATGWVRVRATRWRQGPETLVVPWSRDLRVTGRDTLDVDAGLVLAVEWRPDGVASSLAQTLVVPADGEHLAHLLAVDPSTLEPEAETPPIWEARLAEVVAAIPSDVVSRAELDAALADLTPPAPASHVALDDDGTPFFSPGSTSPQLGVDADNIPYLIGV